MSSPRGPRLERAVAALQGLSVGDAFGEQFFAASGTIRAFIERREAPGGPWRFTDDTVMALSIVETLAAHGRIDQDELAVRFARKYVMDPRRGYGAMAHEILAALARGEDWRDVSPLAFGGTGSKGNGAAMRAGPIGAWFASDPATAAEQARLSAEVTHTHPEGVGGAVAVAVAAATAADSSVDLAEFFSTVLELVPRDATHTRKGIERAAGLAPDLDVARVAEEVGNGSRVLAEDTVPLCLWVVRHHGRDFAHALWTTVAALGDRDTTAAIVGSILGARLGTAAIPAEWCAAREPLTRMSSELGLVE